MNYKRIYDAIIAKRQLEIPEGYSEKHHILPRSLGGSDEPDNLVALTAREHFICHYLLAKMFDRETFEWYKMNHAFMMMKCLSAEQSMYFNSRLYESMRGNFSEVMSFAQSGKKNSQFGTMWIHNINLEKSKKIPKTAIIPDGWIKGRLIAKKPPGVCRECHNEYTIKTKEIFCSVICKKNNRNPLRHREEEFLTLYAEHASMNKALKEMGFLGAVGGYYVWAKKILNSTKK
jgi:hypothetical protein